MLLQNENKSRCGGQCVNLENDENHCGECGKQCKHGKCKGGVCKNECGSKTKCGDSCVDTKTDYNNCGACGKKCGWGEKCEDKVCKRKVMLQTDVVFWNEYTLLRCSETPIRGDLHALI